MFCPNCGEMIPENAKFCPDCGKRIAKQKDIELTKTDVELTKTEESFFTYSGDKEDGEALPNSFEGEIKLPEQSTASTASDTSFIDYAQDTYGRYHRGQSDGMDYDYGQSQQTIRSETEYQSSEANSQQYYKSSSGNGTIYLVLSILATILCCLPFGIAGIVFSSKIDSLYLNGEIEEARKAEQNAKICIIVSAVVPFVIFLGVFVLSFSS